MNSLLLKNASFAYPSSPDSPVLRGLDLSIPLTGATLVLGGNAAGKTALARLLAGLDLPSTGAVRWPEHANGNVDGMQAAVVFEQPEFQFQGFSVAEELAGGLLYRGVDRDQAGELAAVGAVNFGIDSLLDRELDSLDYSQKLAVLVCAFMLLEPRLLVLDFSLAELDKDFRQTLLAACGGDRRPALVVLSRRAEDLVLLNGASVFSLTGGTLAPLPSTCGPAVAADFLRSAGVALPWYANINTAAHKNGQAGNNWSWLARPSE